MNSCLMEHMVSMLPFFSSCRFLLENLFLYLQQPNHFRLSKILSVNLPIFACLVIGEMVFNGLESHTVGGNGNAEVSTTVDLWPIHSSFFLT